MKNLCLGKGTENASICRANFRKPKSPEIYSILNKLFNFIINQDFFRIMQVSKVVYNSLYYSISIRDALVNAGHSNSNEDN